MIYQKLSIDGWDPSYSITFMKNSAVFSEQPSQTAGHTQRYGYFLMMFDDISYQFLKGKSRNFDNGYGQTLVGGTTPKGTKEQWQINQYKQSNMLCESM